MCNCDNREDRPRSTEAMRNTMARLDKLEAKINDPRTSEAELQRIREVVRQGRAAVESVLRKMRA